MSAISFHMRQPNGLHNCNCIIFTSKKVISLISHWNRNIYSQKANITLCIKLGDTGTTKIIRIKYRGFLSLLTFNYPQLCYCTGKLKSHNEPINTAARVSYYVRGSNHSNIPFFTSLWNVSDAVPLEIVEKQTVRLCGGHTVDALCRASVPHSINSARKHRLDRSTISS